MNERSAVTSEGRYGSVCQGERSDVRLLEDRHARIGSELPGELSGPDVHCHHMTRASLQQAVGETAGGGSRIEAVSAGRVDRERVERGGELLPSPRDEGALRPETASASSPATSVVILVAGAPRTVT